MNDAKPLAALSSSLLARKGHARPAMRPQSMILNRDAAQSLEDLGWNDLGEIDEAQHKAHLATVNALTPMGLSPANEQQADLARFYEQDAEEIIAEPAEYSDWQDDALPEEAVQQAETAHVDQPRAVPSAPILRAAPGSKAKAAFTLRLDPDRHLRLRLCAAVSHRSAQMIVTQALDEFLDRQAPTNPFSSPRSAA
jgi:hypothetical protein